MAKKLSSRKLSAEKAGGKPNYSAGKISAPVKQTASKSVAPLVGAGPLQLGQTRQAPLAGPSLPGKVSPGYYDYSNNSVNLTGYKEPSKSSSSNRAKAATPVSGPSSSVKAAEASGLLGTQSTVPTIKSGGGGGIFETLGKMWGNSGLAQADSGAFLTSGQRQANLNAGLGIEGAQAAGPSALGLALAKGSIPDSPTGFGPNGEQYYNGFDPATDGQMMFQSDLAQPGTNFSRPGSELAYNQGTSPIAYGAQRGAQQVAYGSQPTGGTSIASRTPRQTTNQPTSGFSGGSNISLSPEQISQLAPLLQALQSQDNTPVAQNQPGTQRQFLGNGQLSTGMASNGKLDSGLEGLSFGSNPMDNEQNIVNQLLGINTAQAAETPQNFSFQDNQTPMSAFQQGFANGGLTMDQGYSMPQQFGGGTFNPTIADTQARTGSSGEQKPLRTPQPTNTAAQFAQGATGGNSTANPMLDYQKQSMKGFSAQEKAQKKALDELLKSIQNQYSTKQTEGINQLNTAKQEDLLKLSGLFSFANQDPNSEQRIQYEQRANQDYAGQQTDFLAKLAAAMSGDVSQAKQGYQGKLADIAQQKNTAREKIAQLLSQAQMQSQKGRATPAQKSAAYYSPDGSYTFNEVDPVSGLKIFYDPKTNQPFING